MLQIYSPLACYSIDVHEPRTYVYETSSKRLLGYIVKYGTSAHYTHRIGGSLIKSKPTVHLHAAIKRFKL